MKNVPSYTHHKASGQALVRINNRDFYLGRYGSDESHQRYGQLIAEFAASNHSIAFGSDGKKTTIESLVERYSAHAQVYYGLGTTSEWLRFVPMVNELKALYGSTLCREFGPVQYKAFREKLISKDWSRGYVNSSMKRLRRMFRWAVAEDLIPVEVQQKLCMVDPLKRGRTTARECKPVQPADAKAIQAVVAVCTPVLADMISLQLLLACRPGELVTIKPGMIDRSGEVWEIKLDEHKTAWRGKERILYAGPQAQAILKKYLLRGSNDYCFSPRESERQRRAVQHDARVTPLSCGNKPGSNRKAKPEKEPSDHYTREAYTRAIKYACMRAFPEPKELSDRELSNWRKDNHWSPNRLRHAAATDLRSQYDLEAASVLLGHSDLAITQVYAKQNRQKAIAIAGGR